MNSELESIEFFQHRWVFVHPEESESLKEPNFCELPQTNEDFWRTHVLVSLRGASKHVRSFSHVPQLPDRWHRYHLVTCHWLSGCLWKPGLVSTYVTDLAIGVPLVWNLRRAKPPHWKTADPPTWEKISTLNLSHWNTLPFFHPLQSPLSASWVCVNITTSKFRSFSSFGKFEPEKDSKTRLGGVNFSPQAWTCHCVFTKVVLCDTKSVIRAWTEHKFSINGCATVSSCALLTQNQSPFDKLHHNMWSVRYGWTCPRDSVRGSIRLQANRNGESWRAVHTCHITWKGGTSFLGLLTGCQGTQKISASNQIHVQFQLSWLLQLQGALVGYGWSAKMSGRCFHLPYSAASTSRQITLRIEKEQLAFLRWFFTRVLNQFFP